jgi:hypothetical protein
MGLDWPAARELIRRSGAEARACGGRLCCGAGTDQLPPGRAGLGDIVAAYQEQLDAVEQAGAQPVLMCSRALAASAPAEALRALAGTPYARGLDPAAEPAEAQRAVGEALLWQLRVLAGWQPAEGVQALRLLASDYEIANTERQLRALDGAETPPPYRLGALATAWRRLAEAGSADGLRAALAASAWGDPGAATPAAVAVGMRLSAATRTAEQVPAAEQWALGRAALVVAREVHLAGRPLPGPARRWARRALGDEAVRAASYQEFRGALRKSAVWVLAEAPEPADLWRAEARWWRRVEEGGLALARGFRLDVAPVVGTAAALAADAWRVRAALQAATLGGTALEEFDALVG